MTGEQGGQPERRIGRFRKSKVLGRRRVTFVVGPETVGVGPDPVVLMLSRFGGACAAIQDVLVASNGLTVESSHAMKRKLHRIVSMLTRMAMKLDGVVEGPTEYGVADDYEHEHRFAEHEHERVAQPEPKDADERSTAV